MTQGQKPLPIIIAGAGPCGLVAALALQNEGVPFVLIERTTREKLCSDVGSGFDIAPTAVDILQNRLQLDVRASFQKYAGMCMKTMHGETVRETTMEEMKMPDNYTTVTRSTLQQRLLDALLKRSSDDEEKILRCGVQVSGYEQNDKKDEVTVMLDDGSSITGSTLLACDGIKSAIRRHMFRNEEDKLHFCETTCWWGKTELNDEIQAVYDETQSYKSKGTSFVWMLGDRKHPGTFMTAPLGNSILWCFFIKSDSPPTRQSNDLTRRGGVTLDDADKKELEEHIENRADLIKLLVRDTPGSAITKVGLFDREDLNKPYVDGRVALLGDAAHPQSPFMGQGCNMAIVDAYVCATRLARLPETALNEYNSDIRRNSVNNVVKQARSYGNMSVSDNWFTCWMFHTAIRWAPIKLIADDMVNGDQSNRDFIAALDSQLSKT